MTKAFLKYLSISYLMSTKSYAHATKILESTLEASLFED